jgi:hypothetical protein
MILENIHKRNSWEKSMIFRATGVILDKLQPDWRQRSARKRSSWDLPKPMLIFVVTQLWLAYRRWYQQSALEEKDGK